MIPLRRAFPSVWVTLVSALVVLTSCQGEQKPPERQDPVVRTVQAAFTDYRQPVKLTGEVIAHVTTNLSFRVSGKVTEWLTDVGAHVSAGQVVARIDPQVQNADVAAAQAALDAAQAQVRQATSAFNRQSALLSKGSTTQEAFDQAKTALSTAQGSLDSATAALGSARDALSYTELRSDADGIVTARNVETGQVVQAGQTLFTVARDGARDARFDVYETLLFSKPSEGKIQLSLVSDPSVKAQGVVSEVSPTIDAATGTVRVKVAIDDTPARMTLGSAVIGLAYAQPAKRLVLPWTALGSVGKIPALWIVDPKDSTVSLRPVTIASYETGRVLVADGVKAGEIIVVDGTKMLRPGLVVSSIKEQVQ